MSNSNAFEHNYPITFTRILQPNEDIFFRIKGTLTYKADFDQNDEFSNIFDGILNCLNCLKFVIKKLNLLISNENCKILNCYQLFQEYVKHKEIEINSFDDNLTNCISVDLYELKSNIENENNYSPYFINHKGVGCLRIFNIPIDCVINVKRETNYNLLNGIINEKLHQHLIAIKNCYKCFYKNEDNFIAQAFHFLTNNDDLLITCVYPSTVNDELLANLRKEIHSFLNLPSDKPIIRRSNALELDQKREINIYTKQLKNVHLSLKNINKNGKISLVQGDYLYFHYMQDNFNDNGWGCAYRSFQTLFSWFKFQSYTQKPIPSHNDIQKSLVDLGDKPKEFIGSSKWIGSMEISFCLKSMLNIDSRIITVSKGSQLADKARELQYHFDTEGTPIMIGGGVLAHTIIGIYFDEITGSVQYLILDPHYIGPDDTKIITGKGWVGWKENKFWKEDSFYNLCCPIRPKDY